MSDRQCWWRKQRQPQGPDSQAEWRVSDLHPSAPDLQQLSVLTHTQKKTTFKRLKTQCHKKLKSDMDSWPEMALVTDMRGECRAGVTPHTVWYPTIPAKPKVVTIWVKAALGEMMPRARQVETPAERHSSVVVAVRLFIWKEMCRFCHLFRSLFKLYSNGITEE